MLGSDLILSDTDALKLRPGLYLNPRMAALARQRILSARFPDLPGHYWIASSGTSGALKVVALSRGAIEASAAAVNKHLDVTDADCWINPLPLFHVGGLGVVARAALANGRHEFLASWDPAQFVHRATHLGATLSSLVPTQVYDIVSSGLECPAKLRAIVVGGGHLEDSLRRRAADLGWTLLPSYGVTEAASQVATTAVGAVDFSRMPLLKHVEARTGGDGTLELRGPSLLSGWMCFGPDGSACWEDPKVDGWFRTGDRCELVEGFLRFLGRVDDMVKIRGELVDVAALERELQARVVSGLVRIDARHDERSGAELCVIAENPSAESEALAAIDIFPPYARPCFFQVSSIPLSPLGKKIRVGISAVQ